MHADGHFRAAATALRNAAQEKRRELEELRRQIQHEEVNIKQRAHEAREQIRRTEQDMVQAQNNEHNSNAVSRLLQDISGLQKYIGDAQDSFNRHRYEIQDRIRGLEAEINDLNAQANLFETRN